MKIRQRSTSPRRNKIVITILALLCFVLASAYVLKLDYVQYQLKSFGIIETRHQSNRTTISSWNSCLSQLHGNYDIAFIGDSLTAGHDFQSDFPDQSIINLGLNGDTIQEIADRVFMLETVSPKKVFLMAGVNSLQNEKLINKYFDQYAALCESISETVPDAKLYITSILPVSANHDNRFLGNIRGISNGFIRHFNSMLQQYASQHNIVYIDLYQFYELNGSLNPEYARDGIHITDDAYSYWVNAIQNYVYD